MSLELGRSAWPPRPTSCPPAGRRDPVEKAEGGSDASGEEQEAEDVTSYLDAEPGAHDRHEQRALPPDGDEQATTAICRLDARAPLLGSHERLT
jgi:hypothetical protein